MKNGLQMTMVLPPKTENGTDLSYYNTILGKEISKVNDSSKGIILKGNCVHTTTTDTNVHSPGDVTTLPNPSVMVIVSGKFAVAEEDQESGVKKEKAASEGKKGKTSDKKKSGQASSKGKKGQASDKKMKKGQASSKGKKGQTKDKKMKKEIEATCRRVAQGMIEALDLCQVEVSFQKINIEVITK